MAQFLRRHMCVVLAGLACTHRISGCKLGSIVSRIQNTHLAGLPVFLLASPVCLILHEMMEWPNPGLYHTDGDLRQVTNKLAIPRYEVQPCRWFFTLFAQPVNKKYDASPSSPETSESWPVNMCNPNTWCIHILFCSTGARTNHAVHLFKCDQCDKNTFVKNNVLKTTNSSVNPWKGDIKLLTSLLMKNSKQT